MRGGAGQDRSWNVEWFKLWGAPARRRGGGSRERRGRGGGLCCCIFCPGNDAKLIRCVLGTTLNSSVVVQGMTVKLRPCLHFRACG